MTGFYVTCNTGWNELKNSIVQYYINFIFFFRYPVRNLLFNSLYKN